MPIVNSLTASVAALYSLPAMAQQEFQCAGATHFRPAPKGRNGSILLKKSAFSNCQESDR